MVWYELKKAFRKKSLLVLLLCFILIDLFKIASVYNQKSYLVSAGKAWSKSYWNLYEEYEGEITDEKIDRLSQKYKMLEEDVIELTASKEINLDKYMTGTVYSDYNFLNRYYVTPMKYYAAYEKTAREVCSRARNLAIMAKKSGNTEEYQKNAIIYRIFDGRKIGDYSYLESMELYLDYSFSDILILLIIMYGLSAVYGIEREGSMEQLLLTNKKGGKHTQIAKAAGAGLFIISQSVIFSFVDLLGFLFAAGGFYGISFYGMKMPIYAVLFMESSPLNLCVWQFCLLYMVTRTLGFLILGFVMLHVFRICKNILLGFGIGISICTVAALVHENYCHTSKVWIKILNPYSLIDNLHIFEKTEFVSMLGNLSLVWQVALITGGIYLSLLAFLIVAASKNNQYCR